MQFLVYILVYPFLWLVSKLPFRLLYAFSDFLYLLIYRIFGYRKKTVKYNLNLVFPNKTNQEINDITKKFYHHLCDMIVEAIKSLTITESEMRKHFTFNNIELIKELESKDRSVSLMCAHYGSWEWIFVLQTYVETRGNAVYKKLGNKYFDRMVKGIRAKYNTYLISNKEIAQELIKLKRKDIRSITGFVSDQSPKPFKSFHWQKFMGIRVPVHTGAEMLSKRLDLSVVYFSVERLKRGYYECTFKMLSEYPKEVPDYEITDKFLKLVEQQILKAPEFYLWTHKRWKHMDKNPEDYVKKQQVVSKT